MSRIVIGARKERRPQRPGARLLCTIGCEAADSTGIQFIAATWRGLPGRRLLQFPATVDCSCLGAPVAKAAATSGAHTATTTGTHAQLLRRNGLYADMWARQQAEAEQEAEAAE